MDDRPLVRRIIAAYQLAMRDTPRTASVWDNALADMRADVHEALMTGNADRLQDLLRNPTETDLLYGFDNLCRSIHVNITDDAHRQGIVDQAFANLHLLAAALGCARLPNPEHPSPPAPPSADDMVDAIAHRLGIDLSFPNPFPGEIGVVTHRGVISYRATQAIYQAHLVASTGASSAVEIGGGLGRTAFYASAMGIRRYTIVDIPLSGVAQAYFLGRVLGADAVTLAGEEGCGIRIIPPHQFFSERRTFELALNVDSLTELSLETAEEYCREIRSRSGEFLSINHEANNFTVAGVAALAGLSLKTREPYWLRPGYVQETYGVSPQRALGHFR